MQTTNNNQTIERVRYNPSARPNRHDSSNPSARVLARNYIYPESASFYVLFDSSTTATTIRFGFLKVHFPCAHFTRYDRPTINGRFTIIGHADIAIYVEGFRESFCIEREGKRQFQFDLQVHVIAGSGGQNAQGLVVGLQDMTCFDLSLHVWESRLVLRPNDYISTRGIILIC
jgi:hypothetical protein